MEPKVSVIIPIYNVEKYLLQCLESVRDQTFQNFEAILVDDGSQDGSAELAKCFIRENKLEDKFHLMHKENGGLSSARNAGMDCAKGTWFLFLDSDDWMELDALMSLDICLREHPSDLVIGGYQAYNNVTAETEVWSDYPVSCGCLPEKLAILPPFSFCWGRLYNARIIRENNLRFDERIRYAEDNAWQFDYVRCIQSFSCTNTVIYNYRINRNGALTAGLVPPSAKYHIYEHMERFYQNVSVDQYEEIFTGNTPLHVVTWSVLSTSVVNEILNGNDTIAKQRSNSILAQAVKKSYIPRSKKEMLFNWLWEHPYFLLKLFCKVYYRNFAALRKNRVIVRLSKNNG